MIGTLGSPEQDRNGERLEECKRGIRDAYSKALRILRSKAAVSEDRAYECLNTAIGNLLSEWRSSGPPDQVSNWAAYLVQSAFHVHIKGPVKDERLLVFMPPVADLEYPVPLDPPSREPGPQEKAVAREEFDEVWEDMVTLSGRQMLVLVLWAIGLSYAGIAYGLDTTESHVRSIKDKAIKSLKRGIETASSFSRVRLRPETT